MNIKKMAKRIRRNIHLKAYENNIYISKSTILNDDFKIHFYVKPENRNYVHIGNKCLLNCDIYFESNKGSVLIGDNVYIGEAKIISRENVTIGNDVTMSWGITIYDHNSHSIYWEDRKRDNEIQYNEALRGTLVDDKDWSNVISEPVVIGDKVWIGFDTVVLKGVTIGEGAVVGARSVVTKDVDPYTVVAGNPARVVKRIGEKSDE